MIIVIFIMKVALILSAVLAVSFASSIGGDLGLRLDENGPDPRSIMFMRGSDGQVKTINLKSNLNKMKVTPDHLIIYHASRDGTTKKILSGDINQLAETDLFKRHLQTVIIIHGWDNNVTSPVNTMITEAIFDHYNLNIFIADWSSIAMKSYLTAKQAVPEIGQLLGQFVNDLVQKYDYSYKDVIMIGHSLGAHIAGVAGAQTLDKITQIVGLDPASPLFDLHQKSGHLDQSDADFVHVIHTNAGLLGVVSPIGDADYYPNGGRKQPGCKLDFLGECAHSRSYEYYAASIKFQYKKFLAYRCHDYKDFEKSKCNKSEEDESVMGRLYVDKSAKGTYYLETNPDMSFV